MRGRDRKQEFNEIYYLPSIKQNPAFLSSPVLYRYDWKWTVGIAAGRLFFYNVLNVVLLLAFSPRLGQR